MTAVYPSYEAVLEAAHTLNGHAHRTPVLRSQTLNARLQATVYFKAENLQRIGAFKFRGAFNAISRLTPAQKRAGVVTFSSGNHAQAVALAARLLDVTATVIMPADAPKAKVAATQGYGGQVVFHDRHKQDREAMAQALVAQQGVTLIPPFNHPDVIAGQGTAAKELFEEVGPLDYLFVPLGGGGLLSGSLLAAEVLAPDCKVIGVEPEAGNDAWQSLRAGYPVQIPQPDSIADGAVTRQLGDLTFDIIKSRVHDIQLVDDASLVEAMQFFAERMKIVVEPTGCLGAAAAFRQAHERQGKRVGVLLSGGNVDLASYARYLSNTW